MRYSTEVEIEAPPERVWAVLEDVERWPVWSPTMTIIVLREPGRLRRGTVAEVRQPGVRPSTWVVTRVEPGRRFEWVTGAPGLRIRADHVVEPRPGQRCRVVQDLEFSGPLRGIAAVFAARARRYLDIEARSLRHVCER